MRTEGGQGGAWLRVTNLSCLSQEGLTLSLALVVWCCEEGEEGARLDRRFGVVQPAWQEGCVLRVVGCGGIGQESGTLVSD